MKPTVLFLSVLALASLLQSKDKGASGTLLPTGKKITPNANPGAHFLTLNPGLTQFPDYLAGQAMSMAISPDGRTLLILTSGFNKVNGKDGEPISSASNEYVFVYDIHDKEEPEQEQVLFVPNTFAGIVFAPNSRSFYVTGGKDDNVHIFAEGINGRWVEDGTPIPLGHKSGLGLSVGKEPLVTGGADITADGQTLIVANVYNDSVSLVDLKARTVKGEVDLRPGKIDPHQSGIPGGEYPFWVSVRGSQTAYISSVRDREIIILSLQQQPHIIGRVKVKGNPNKMTLSKSQFNLFICADNSDTVSILNTRTNRIEQIISTIAPAGLVSEGGLTGSDPNDLSLSPDEKTLYVSNGESNSVAVIDLTRKSRPQVIGLIPTGWYPTSVRVSADGKMLYVVNGKSGAGPNPNLHNKIQSKNDLKPGPAVVVNSQNQYIYQLEKAGFLTMPVPGRTVLQELTKTVADNNSFTARTDVQEAAIMSELHRRIHHVIYIIKENRTYDQVLGDLGKGNGDSSLTEFGEGITPNFHQIARRFVDLDNFYNSGEVSGDGWPWSTAGKESDFSLKTIPLNYAGRGTNYESEGLNRDLNVGLGNLKERRAANPKTPDDPDLLPGAVNVTEPDGPAGTPAGKGYLWDAVLRAHLTFREYGCMSDTNLDAPRTPNAFQAKVIQSRPANPELYQFGDPYYRGFDPGYPDFYREAEWEREFADYIKNRSLPNFEIVQMPGDHMGEFKTAISGVNTPELQQADNDYATARLIEQVANSVYKDDTLIFILEDDSQDGPDHVDAHRSTAYVVGPYVKQGAVVSDFYTTVSMLRTMEDVLGLKHLNLNTATARPMTNVFDLHQRQWSFSAKPSPLLQKTKLPIANPLFAKAATATPSLAHTAEYWAEQTAGFDFHAEDRIDADAFNRILWGGLMKGPYPTIRSQINLRR